MDGEILLNSKDMCRLFKISDEALRQRLLTNSGVTIPKPIRLGRRLFWRPQDVENWLEEQAKKSGAVPGPEDDPPPPRRRRGRPRKSENANN